MEENNYWSPQQELTFGSLCTVFPITTWKCGGFIADWYIHTVSSLSKSGKRAKLTFMSTQNNIENILKVQHPNNASAYIFN